jgi:hypothetical protein
VNTAASMEYELIFSARSEEETKSAIDYYDQINPELGDRFFIELLETYKKLAITPQYYSFISSVRDTNIRDIKLPSFPYVVVFEITGTTVNVISVMNCYRKPFIV